MKELREPKVTCLMECSVDGRIDESRWSDLYDSVGEGNPDVYYETREMIAPEAILLGRVTIERNFCNNKFTSESYTKPKEFKPFLGIRTCETVTCVFDSHGTLAYENNLIWDTTLLVVLGEDFVSEEYLGYLRKKEISYTFAGSDGHDLKKAIKSFYEDFGLKNMLLAGGGLLNGQFLKQALIDELYLVIYPGIDGLSSVNSIFEYQGKDQEKPCKDQMLELCDCKVVRAGVVLLNYKFHKMS